MQSKIKSTSKQLTINISQVQTLINQKTIEVPGGKKPWYKFWGSGAKNLALLQNQ